MFNKKMEFTLEQYKAATERLEAGEFNRLSRNELKLLTGILRNDIERRERRLEKQKDKLARANLSAKKSSNEPPSARSEGGDNDNTDGDHEGQSSEKPNTNINRNPLSHDHSVEHQLEGFTAGEPCPRCGNSLYMHNKKVVIRITCAEPLQREKHLCQSALCKSCGFRKSASPGFDEEALIHQFSPQAAAFIIVAHYYLGMAFYRFKTLMSYFNKKYAPSTQWDVVSGAFDRLQPLFLALSIYARENAKSVRIDDAGAKILRSKSRIRDGTTKSKSINTTAMYFELAQASRISLFYTGEHHGGDVSDALAKQRSNTTKLVRISDAAAKNFAVRDRDAFIDACCNEHAFAYFRNIRDNHPESYEFVAEVYGNVYENDAYCRDHGFSDDERLAYHQKHSLKEMIRLRNWAFAKLNNQYIEANSDEGIAIQYLANQFVKLTEFLRTPGVPIDTNLVEQFLRVSKRYFRNSSFYLTMTGAEVGDTMMSLIRTAVDAKISPINYLAWCLENYRNLKEDPTKYFPWEFAKLSQPAKCA